MCSIPLRAEIPECHTYTCPVTPDLFERLNDSVNILATICVDHKLLIVNNLKSDNNCFKSKLTYRAGTQWISELDICISCRNLKCTVCSHQ